MSTLTGIHLVLLIGPTVPLPAPLPLTQALERVEVTQSDEGAAGFQLVFKAGRGQPFNLVDYPLLKSRLLKPFSRVILLLRIGMKPQVLFDGVITDQQLTPSDKPGAGLLTVTGEDLTVLMDLEEKIVAHPAQNEVVIANKLIASYARYGVTPLVIPPPTLDLPLPIERIPVQHGSDLAYLQAMAQRYAYDFYLTPGPLPGANIAYWGPPKRLGLPQRALTTNMGPLTNLTSINFRYNALAPQRVAGQLEDRRTNRALPMRTFTSSYPPLARQPALVTQTRVRQRLLGQSAGLTATDARARAQALTDDSTAAVVTAEGELEITRYGALLTARKLVGVRGVGDSFDGLYYVQQVTSEIAPATGTFKQRFTLTRDGVGTLTPLVVP